MNFYDSFIEGAQGSNPRERGDFYVAVLEYLYYRREPDFKLCKWAEQSFKMIRPILDSQLAKQKAGRKGGKTRASNQANSQAEAKQTTKQTSSKDPSKSQAEAQAEAQADGQAECQANGQAKANLTGTVTIKEKVSPKGDTKKKSKQTVKQTAFVPPTVEEVDEYLAEKGLSAYLTGEEFVGYYGSQGWKKVNGLPITDWKKAASGWASRDRRKATPKTRGYDYADYD